MKREVGQLPGMDVSPAVSPALTVSGLFLHFNMKSRVAQRGYSSELVVPGGFSGAVPQGKVPAVPVRAGWTHESCPQQTTHRPSKSPLCSAAKIKLVDNLLPTCLLNKLHIQMKTEKL